MFKDKVTLNLVSGDGGAGVVAWRREKYVPKGGPFGGDGGDGGSVYIEAEESLFSLDRFRHKQTLEAQRGGSGGTNCCHGKNGVNQTLKVPCGTLLKCAKSGEVLFDFTEHGMRFCVCKGGKGGRGNAHFKNSVNRAPNFAMPGTEGEKLTVELELKLIADVGLVGFPNAGKSTLLSTTTSANAKAGAYPFTTLSPNLGSVLHDDTERYVIADIPGIIEGAHRNKGLGLEFLRHIDRTGILLFVIDMSGLQGRDPCQDFQTLMNELIAYNPLLLHKPFVVALNKVDLPEAEEWIQKFNEVHPMPKEQVFEISAATGQGVAALVDCLKRKLTK